MKTTVKLQFGPNVKNSIHVFDHTIKPILLYGSEVWGYFNPFKKILQSNDLVLDQILLLNHTKRGF
jgi:hypothetical protein